MREVTVRCKWESVHTIEVEDDEPKFSSDELDRLLEVTGDDVTSNVAELVDWAVFDKGPVAQG